MAQYPLGFGRTNNPMSGGQTRYFTIANTDMGVGGRVAELDVQAPTYVAGNYSKLFARIVVNNIDTGTITVTSRKNNANGNLNLSVASGVTGSVFDLSDIDVIASSDNYDYVASVSGTTGNFSFNASTLFVPTTTSFDQVLGGSGTISAASTTNYYPIVSTFAGSTTVESGVQSRIKNSVTVRNLQYRVSTNGRSTNSTFVSRKNTANGNLTGTITAGVTGLYTDLSNSDSLTSTDQYCFSITNGTGAGNLITSAVRSQLDYTSNTYDVFVFCVTAGGYSRAGSATQQWVEPFGSVTNTITGAESSKSQAVYTPIIVSKVSANVTVNTYASAGTVVVYKNGNAGNGTFTITAGVTGFYEDTTNSDTFSVGDTMSYGIVGGTSGSVTITWFGAQFQDIFTAPGNSVQFLNLLGIGT